MIEELDNAVKANDKFKKKYEQSWRALGHLKRPTI